MPRSSLSRATSGPATLPIDAATVLDHLAVAVLVASREGEILYRNLEAAHMLADGADLSSVLSVAQFGPESHWRIRIAQVLSTRSASQWSGSFVADPTRQLQIRCTPLHISGAAVPVAVLYLEKVGGAGKEEEHDDSRRLTSLGKLAARVAHELNNPLDGILRYINLAIRVSGAPPESRLNSYLSESRTGLMRMIRIIGDLLEFSRSSDSGFEEMGVNELIEQAIKACATAADLNRVIVSADFQSDQMPRLRGSRLYQACCNLLRNAIDAMPDGGRLSIATGLLDECVVIRVTDTGVGLPEPTDKIFEPFYTTKQPGKGTGLGLAICREFIEDMSGTITAANTDAGGAMFTVRIPVAGLQSASPLTKGGLRGVKR